MPDNVMTLDNSILMLLVGPTASGKTTLLREMLAKRSDIARMVTATTRAPRAGEVDGKDYYFLDRAEFEDRIERGYFLEFENVHGELYGTPRDGIYHALSENDFVIKDVDVRGALSISRAYPEQTVTVFILPPSPDEMLRRLRYRGTEDEQAIRRRLKTCEEEIKYMSEFDYWVTNDTVAHAVEELESILVAERNRMSRRMRSETWTTDNLNF